MLSKQETIERLKQIIGNNEGLLVTSLFGNKVWVYSCELLQLANIGKIRITPDNGVWIV